MAKPFTFSEDLQPFKGYSAVTGVGSGNLPTKLDLVISNIIGFLTLISGLAFIFYFLIGAVNWVTSSGDAQKLKTAQQMIYNAIIGLTITVIAYPAIYIVSQVLGIHITSPADLINEFKFF